MLTQAYKSAKLKLCLSCIDRMLLRHQGKDGGQSVSVLALQSKFKYRPVRKDKNKPKRPSLAHPIC